MQVRIGHTHLGEYYRDFNIPEDISCPCGTTIQTHIHILSECPLLDEHRHLLHDKEQNIIPTNLFGTKKGIECLTEFVRGTPSDYVMSYSLSCLSLPIHYSLILPFYIFTGS
jgi:hypothetical protein